jgi:hypothetical protein
MDSENKLKFFINQFEEGGEHQELSNDDWTVLSFLKWLEINNFEIIKSREKGVLRKQEGSWQVHSNGKVLPLHPVDASQLETDSNGDILIGKEIEFKIQGLYAKYCLPKHMEINLL